MQVFSAELDKEGIDLVSVVTLLGFSGLGSQFLTDLNFLIRREQVGYFSTIQKVVDIFKEGFSDDLRV